MAKLLGIENGAARVSEYEIGRREPALMTLLQYAKLTRVSLDVLADDTRELKFRKNWKRPRRVNEVLMQDGLRRIEIRSQHMRKATLSRRLRTP